MFLLLRTSSFSYLTVQILYTWEGSITAICHYMIIPKLAHNKYLALPLNGTQLASVGFSLRLKEKDRQLFGEVLMVIQY